MKRNQRTAGRGASSHLRRKKPPRPGPNLKWRVKRAGYSLMAGNWRGAWIGAVAFGLVCSLLFTSYHYYRDYAAAKASISVVYPEIAGGTYPDGSRFTMYSLADEEAVQAVLDEMQAEGKYSSFTAADLMQGIRVTAVIDDSVGETVASMQSEGNDYSYYSSRYEISFVQPRAGENFSLSQLVEANHTEEFLQRLIACKQEEIACFYGKLNAFREMTRADVPDTLDYDEWVTTFDANNRAIRSFLRNINQSAGNFHSDTTGKTIGDLIGMFTTMGEERLTEISNYIKNSGLTRDRESFLNKLNVRIENAALACGKAVEEASINGYAMNAYDHTFTENLLIVATSADNGLYQARPKTVFDTVVNQYNDATNRSIEYANSIQDMQDELAIYQQTDETSAEYQRMAARCSELMEAYEADYRDLCALAMTTLTDYLSFHNNGYLEGQVEPDWLFSLRFVLRILAVFGMGSLVVVMMRVVLSPLGDRRTLRRRRREMERNQQDQAEGRPAPKHSAKGGRRRCSQSPNCF